MPKLTIVNGLWSAVRAALNGNFAELYDKNAEQDIDIQYARELAESKQDGIQEAPMDGKFHSRINGVWANPIVMDESGSFDDSNNIEGVVYFVKNNDNFKVYFGSSLIFNGQSTGETGQVVAYPLLVGVVDGEIDFEEQTYSNGNGATHSVSDGDVTVSSNGNTFSRVNGVIDSNANQKMIVFKCQNIAGTDEGSVRIYNKADTTEIDRVSADVYDVEKRLVFTPDVDGYAIRLYGALGTSEAAQKRYYDMAVYDVIDLPGYGEAGFDPLTCTLPLSGEAVDGNSRKYQNEDTSTYIEPIATSADPNPLPSGDFVNVKDYGAVGDGVTDDTAAFAAALAVGSIVVPAGLYILLGLSVPSDRIIQGVDKATSQVRINYSIAADHEACMNIIGKSNVTLKNITFEMTPPWTFQGNAWTGKKVAYIRNCTNIHVENVDCKNNEHGCFYLGGNSYVYFTVCEFINVDTGINSDHESGDSFIYVLDCLFDGHYLSEPVYLDQATDIEIRGCIARNKEGGSAFRFWKCDRVIVDDNVMENMGNGTYLEGCDDVQISNNTFTSIRWSPVKDDHENGLYSTNVVLSGNTPNVGIS